MLLNSPLVLHFVVFLLADLVRRDEADLACRGIENLISVPESTETDIHLFNPRRSGGS
jgi:hypothetical protein